MSIRVGTLDWYRTQYTLGWADRGGVFIESIRTAAMWLNYDL